MPQCRPMVPDPGSVGGVGGLLAMIVAHDVDLGGSRESPLLLLLLLLISAIDSIFEANKTQRCLNSTTATADNSSRVHFLFSPQRVGVLKLRAPCGIRHAVNRNPFAPACARLIAHPSSFNNCSSDREGSRRVRIENVGWRSATRQGSNEKQSGQR